MAMPALGGISSSVSSCFRSFCLLSFRLPFPSKSSFISASSSFEDAFTSSSAFLFLFLSSLSSSETKSPSSDSKSSTSSSSSSCSVAACTTLKSSNKTCENEATVVFPRILFFSNFKVFSLFSPSVLFLLLVVFSLCCFLQISIAKMTSSEHTF